MEPLKETILLILAAIADERSVKKLAESLLPLQSSCRLRIEHRSRIKPGTDQAVQMQTWLAEASAVILLVSGDFLADQKECLPLAGQAMSRHQQDELPVLSVLVRPCAWEATSLLLPRLLRIDNRALSEHGSASGVWAKLGNEVIGWLEAAIPGLSRILAAQSDIERKYRDRISKHFGSYTYWIELKVQSRPGPISAASSTMQADVLGQPTICSPSRSAQSAHIAVFLGGSTMGKSSLLYAMGLRAARTGLLCSAVEIPNESWDTQERAMLPVLVPLEQTPTRRNERYAKSQDLLDFAADWAEKKLAIPKLDLLKLYRRTMAAGRLLLLIDNLGGPTTDPESQRTIENMALNFIRPVERGNRVIITGPPDLQLVAVPAQLAQIGVLQNLSAAQRETFIGNAVRCEAENANASGGGQSEELTRRLLTQLGTDEGVKQLLDQPQLLAIWVQMRMNSRGEVKRVFSRLELLKEYLDRRLEHSVRQTQPAPRDFHREKEHSGRLLSALALQILESPNREALPRSRLARSLAVDFARQEKKNNIKLTTAEIDRVLANLTKYSGLLIESTGGRLSFSHATFLTFYAACALSEMEWASSWDMIRRHLSDVRWREPIAFCAGLLGQFEPDERAATTLIGSILDEVFAPSEPVPSELFLGVAAALEGRLAKKPELVRLVQGLCMLALSTVPTVRSQALAGLCQLARAGQSEAISALIAWLSEPAPQVYVIHATAALAEILPFGPVALRLRALCHHQSPPIRAAAIVALGGVVAQDSELRSALYTELDSLEDEVAQASYKVLLPSFSTDGETQKQIQSRLTAANSRAVNNAFVNLSEEALDDPTLREILYKRIADQPALVRQQLLIQLLTRALSDLDDRARLIAALNDSSEHVRMSVLSSLFYLSRFDSGIRDAVLSRIEGSWPPEPIDVPAQIVGLHVLFVRFMNMGDPNVWKAVRTKFTDSKPFVREWMATALEPWVAQIPELESILWRMVADDQEETEVRRAALTGLLPSMAARPERRELLLRRWSGATAAPMPFMPTMVHALGYLGRYDPAAQQLIEQLLAEHKRPVEQYLLLSALLQSRPRDQELTKQLLCSLSNENPWMILGAFNNLSCWLTPRDLDCQEVIALFTHPHALVRRSAVQWLIGITPRNDQVEALLLDRLSDKDSTVFELCFFNLLSQAQTNPETFAQWANALYLFKSNSPVLSQPWMLALSIMLAIHTNPEAALAKLRLRASDLAEQLESALPQATTFVANPASAVHHYAEIFNKQPGPPIMQFVLAFLQGKVAKNQGLLLNDDIKSNLDSQSPRLQMSAFGMIIGQEQLPSEWSPVESVRDSSVAPILRIAGIMALAIDGDLPATELATLRSYLFEPELLPRVVALRAFLENGSMVAQNSELAASLIPWLGLITEGAYDLRGELPGPQSIAWNGVLSRQKLAALIAWHLPKKPEMYAQVVALLDSPSWQARQAAAWALVFMYGGAPEQVRGRLLELVKDTRSDNDLLERLIIARALLALGSLPEAIEDEMWRVAEHAIQHGLQPWEFIPQQGKAVRESAVRLISELPRGPAQRSLLEKVIKGDPNPDVRCLAYDLVNAAPIHDTSKVHNSPGSQGADSPRVS